MTVPAVAALPARVGTFAISSSEPSGARGTSPTHPSSGSDSPTRGKKCAMMEQRARRAS